MFQRAPPEVNGFGVMISAPLGDQVVPVLDALRVALADDEHDDRVLDDAVVVVLRLPVVGDDPRVDEPRDVGLEREVDDVGRQAGLDRPRLVAGGAERVLNSTPRPSSVFW